VKIEKDIKENEATYTAIDKAVIKHQKKTELVTQLSKELSNLHERVGDLSSVDLKYQYKQLQNELSNCIERSKAINIVAKRVEYTDNVESLYRRVKRREESLATHTLIKTKCKVAECIILNSKIAIFNGILSKVCTAIWDSPITVTAKLDREKKGTSAAKAATEDNKIYGFNIEIYDVVNQYAITRISGGERNRLNIAVMIALNIMSNSSLLILDESMMYFDTVASRLEVIKLLRSVCEEYSTSIIVVDHALSEDSGNNLSNTVTIETLVET